MYFLLRQREFLLLIPLYGCLFKFRHGGNKSGSSLMADTPSLQAFAVLLRDMVNQDPFPNCLVISMASHNAWLGSQAKWEADIVEGVSV